MVSKANDIPTALRRIEMAVLDKYGYQRDGTHVLISGEGKDPSVSILVGTFEYLNLSLIERMVKAVELQGVVAQAIGRTSLIGNASINAGEFGACLRFKLKEQIGPRGKPKGRRKRKAGEWELPPL